MRVEAGAAGQGRWPPGPEAAKKDQRPWDRQTETAGGWQEANFPLPGGVCDKGRAESTGWLGSG